LNSVHYYANSTKVIHSVLFDDVAYLSFTLHSNFILNLKVDSAVTDPAERLSRTDRAKNYLSSYKTVAELKSDVCKVFVSMGLSCPASLVKRSRVESASSLEKRTWASTVAPETKESYLRYCPLNETETNQDIFLGCFAGLIAYCNTASATNSTAQTECRSYWNVVFDSSVYNPLSICFTWRRNSANCFSASRTIDQNYASRKAVADFINLWAFPNTTSDFKSQLWI